MACSSSSSSCNSSWFNRRALRSERTDDLARCYRVVDLGEGADGAVFHADAAQLKKGHGKSLMSCRSEFEILAESDFPARLVRTVLAGLCQKRAIATLSTARSTSVRLAAV
jgi:hypothetical protein